MSKWRYYFGEHGSSLVEINDFMWTIEFVFSFSNGECFEHAMSKVAQYAIINDKVSNDSMPIIGKFTQASL